MTDEEWEQIRPLIDAYYAAVRAQAATQKNNQSLMELKLTREELESRISLAVRLHRIDETLNDLKGKLHELFGVDVRV